jgi:tryptophan 2,3-dioxygenase
VAGYHKYLELDQLLSLQQPLTEHTTTELAFIIVHQVSELWFKLIIDDIRSTIRALCEHDTGEAQRRLSRIHEVEHFLVSQFVIIDQLPLGGFGAIRPALGTASAAESQQFAIIERLSSPPPSSSQATRRAAGPAQGAQDLWTALCLYVASDGYDMPTEDTEEARTLRHKALLDMYRQCGPTSTLCESLIDHDQAFCLWRQRHALAVARQIGDVPGTGGTSGLAYLERRSNRRFFPELWSVRAELGSPS